MRLHGEIVPARAATRGEHNPGRWRRVDGGRFKTSVRDRAGSHVGPRPSFATGIDPEEHVDHRFAAIGSAEVEAECRTEILRVGNEIAVGFARSRLEIAKTTPNARRFSGSNNCEYSGPERTQLNLTVNTDGLCICRGHLVFKVGVTVHQ